MRRERNGFKVLIISIVFVAIAIIMLISFLVSKGIRNSRENQFAGEMSKLSDELSESGTVSTQIGKNVEEAKKEEIDEEEQRFELPEIDVENNNINETKQTNTVENNKNTKNKVTTTNSEVKEEEKKEEKKEKKKDENEKIKFDAPIKGQILREFAKDSLVFSNTLQEWVTHNGVDIKADKTSVVKSAAKGTVSAIKNDPRYGLTVIITHDNGYQTVYSNLLTAEFVVKGEKVEIGQSIGTVGNSASFEIADEYHLHFELLKDNEYINPVTCINFE